MSIPFISRDRKWLRRGLKFARSVNCCCEGDHDSFPGEIVFGCPACTGDFAAASKRYQITIPSGITNGFCTGCDDLPGSYIVEGFVFPLGGQCEWRYGWPGSLNGLPMPFCGFTPNLGIALQMFPATGQPGFYKKRVLLSILQEQALWEIIEPKTNCNFANFQIPFSTALGFNCTFSGVGPAIVSAAA